MRGQGPGSNEIEQSYCQKAINWTHGLYLDAGPRPKSGKLRLNLHGTWVQDQKLAN